MRPNSELPLTEHFQYQDQAVSSSSSPPTKTSILARFTEAELVTLHRLVHQECRDGVLSLKKLKNIYADIFPMVDITYTGGRTIS